MPETGLEKYLASLNGAAKNLRIQASWMDQKVIAALTKAQANMFSRVAELAAASPLDKDLAVKIAWYGKNIGNFGSGPWADELLADYRNVVNQYLAGYGKLKLLADEVGAMGLLMQPDKFTAAIPPELYNALLSRDINHFNFLGQEALDKLDDVFLTNFLSTTSMPSMLAELKGVITGDYKWGTKRGLYEWHAGTYARTAHMRFTREYMAGVNKEFDVKYYLYLGPADGKMREFCGGILGQVHTEKDILQMDNGQTGNVLIDGGGWNCRHTWIGCDSGLAKAIQNKSSTIKVPETKKKPKTKVKAKAKAKAKASPKKISYTDQKSLTKAMEKAQKDLGVQNFYKRIGKHSKRELAELLSMGKMKDGAGVWLTRMNTTLKSMANFMNKYPQFKGNFPSIVLHSGDNAGFATVLERMVKGFSAGYDDLKKLELGLKRQYFSLRNSKYSKMTAKEIANEKAYLKATGKRYWAMDIDKERVSDYVFRHECGHLITDETIMNKWQQATMNAGADLAWFESNVSKYAGDSIYETFAEAFAWYTGPSYTPGALPKVLEEVLEFAVERGNIWP